MLTPYQFASNSLIAYIDLDGLESAPPPLPRNAPLIEVEYSEGYLEGTSGGSTVRRAVSLPMPIDVPPGSMSQSYKGGHIVTSPNGISWFEPGKNIFGPQPPAIQPDFRTPLEKTLAKTIEEFQHFKNNLGQEKPTILPEIKPISLTPPPAQQTAPPSEESNSPKVYLARFGIDDKEKLSNDAANAEKVPGFGHGVSTKLKTKVSNNERAALLSDVEKVFKVKKTGKDPSHFTVILPKPITEEVVKKFNSLFKRKT
jgi:hypothetical protein